MPDSDISGKVDTHKLSQFRPRPGTAECECIGSRTENETSGFLNSGRIVGSLATPVNFSGKRSTLHRLRQTEDTCLADFPYDVFSRRTWYAGINELFHHQLIDAVADISISEVTTESVAQFVVVFTPDLCNDRLAPIIRN